MEANSPNEKQQLVDEFVAEHKLYESKTSVAINLRELSYYCHEHGIDTTSVGEDVVAGFRRQSDGEGCNGKDKGTTSIYKNT